MPAKRILFGFLLCLALWLVVLAAQALTLGTEKSLFPYRTEQVACVEFQNGTTGARHLDKAQRVIQDVMDHLHRFSPDAAVPNQWEGWTYGITLHLKDGQTCMLTLHPAAQAEVEALEQVIDGLKEQLRSRRIRRMHSSRVGAWTMSLAARES